MKVIVVLSGGLDSTVLLHHHLNKSDEVRAITIDYGQRHDREIKHAQMTCRGFSIPHIVLDLSVLGKALPGSSQTDHKVPVPHGKYDEESMKATVVPNRNMILLSVAIGHAVAHKFDAVSYAAHAGDHAIYPDCREEFVDALAEAARLCDWHPVELLHPFVTLTKAQIVAEGARLEVNFRDTYSCYEGNPLHCGRCGTCVERILAFREAGVKDPTSYQDLEYYKKFLVA